MIGEDLGLLIGDGLAVDVEGIFGVIAKAVKESVGVCGDSGRGEGEGRGDAGGLGFQGELGKKFTVDIDMEGGRSSQPDLRPPGP